MPLTDTKIKAIYAKAQRGETVGKESDGGGLNFQSGKYWRLSYRFGGKQKSGERRFQRRAFWVQDTAGEDQAEGTFKLSVFSCSFILLLFGARHLLFQAAVG